MSVAPSSATYPASAIRNNSLEHESFKKFFECWLSEQNNHLQELISAVNSSSSTAADEATLRSLIERVVKHYESYYKAKAMWAKQDAVAMLIPSWLSSLEDAFLWIGGWRPTMAFHLLYSKSGLQLQAPGKLADVIRGPTPTTSYQEDLADLSPSQLRAVKELQRKTIREEQEITEKMAKHQETVAASDMVELSHVATMELLRAGGGDRLDYETERAVESALAPKERGLEETLLRADELRLSTLKAVVEILSPIQAVHFLIAAAELHLRLHEWGKKRDATPHHPGDHSHQ